VRHILRKRPTYRPPGSLPEASIIFAPPATRAYLKYGLAETVFELWRTRPDLFAQDFRHSDILANSRELDRSHADHTRHDLNFPEYVRRTLAQFKIAFPPDRYRAGSGLRQLVARACDGGYELYHEILRNATDRAGGSDLGDLTHAGCLPHVDGMTLDRRMRNYVAQADRSLGWVGTVPDSTVANSTHRDLDTGAMPPIACTERLQARYWPRLSRLNLPPRRRGAAPKTGVGSDGG
jgi:hypothetical protein